MRIILALAGLLAVPAVCSAHSGTLVRAAANYLPMLTAVVPLLLAAFAKRLKRLLAAIGNLFTKK